jgi:hypothetical protein
MCRSDVRLEDDEGSGDKKFSVCSSTVSGVTWPGFVSRMSFLFPLARRCGDPSSVADSVEVVSEDVSPVLSTSTVRRKAIGGAGGQSRRPSS